MSWWRSLFKKSSSAQDSTPDFGLDIRIGFSNDTGSWEESVNLLDCLEVALSELGHVVVRHSDHLVVDGLTVSG